MNKPSWDSQKRRAVINWRFPREVHPLTGPWYRHRFPVSVTMDSADKASLAIHLPAFYAVIDAARVKLGQPSTRLAIWGEGIRQRDAAVAELESVWREKTDQVQFHKLAHKLGKTVAGPVAGPVGEVEVNDVIDAWVAERVADRHPPAPKSIANKRSKLAALFAFLKHANMGAVTEGDLKRYRGHLVPLGLAHDHLSDLVVKFRVAYRNGLLPVNPASDLDVPRKVRNSRDVFSPAEATMILAASRRCDNPVIKWGTLLSAATGAAGKEIFEATTADIYEVDGVAVFHVRAAKNDFRPRIVPLHSAIRDDFLAYVASLPAGPLFPQLTGGRRSDKASAMLAKFLEGKAADGKVAYCWRHTVCTALERVPGVSADLARHIVGHAPRDVHARNYVHYSIADLVPAIEGLAI